MAILELAMAASEERGLHSQHVTVGNTNDVAQAAQSLIGAVDAIYIPADNTVAAAMPVIAQIAGDAGIPVITASTGAARSGGLATIGVDFYQLGRINADQALDIILRGVDIRTMPVVVDFQTYLFVSEAFAESINFTIPAHIRERMVD